MTAHPPASELVYKRDESRPGGGVFVVQGDKEGYRDIPPGVIIDPSEEQGGPSTSERRQPTTADSSTYAGSQFTRTGPSVPLIGSPSPMVQPLGGGEDQNMNPTMTGLLAMGPQSAHVMNVLGAPQMASNAAMVDLGLEGMPGGMFDWGESLRSSIFPFLLINSGSDIMRSTPESALQVNGTRSFNAFLEETTQSRARPPCANRFLLQSLPPAGSKSTLNEAFNSDDHRDTICSLVPFSSS